MPNRPLKLLSIGHSYVVQLNRRLLHEMVRAGGSRWEVSAVAPKFFHGDLSPLKLDPSDCAGFRMEAIDARLSRWIHVMHYSRRLKSILAEPWDMVHGWEEPYCLAAAQIASYARPESKLAFLTYQNISKKYPPPFSWLERYTMRKAAGWISGGELVTRAVGQRPEYAARPMRRIPLGVDVEVFRPQPEAGAAVHKALGWTDPGPAVIGYLGRFVPEKGVPFLTKVLDQLATPWRAMFVGGGPGEAALRAWAQQRPEQVRVVTGVSHDRVPEHLNAMDVLCAPSQTTAIWKEQLGRMLIEAFACGLPVVASDSGEIPYVVDDAGVIVGEADEQGWTRALEELISSPDRRRELAARGLARAHDVFSWSVVARDHLTFFEELVDGKPGADRAS